MARERRLAEGERHRVRRRQRDAVGAQARAGWDEHRRAFARAVGELPELVGGDAWHVARHGQEDTDTAPRRLGLRERDGGRVAPVLRLGDGLGAERARNRGGGLIARDDPHAPEIGRRERAQHVAQHRARELAALADREHARQPLLGVRQILDRHRDDEPRPGAVLHVACRPCATSSTRRASAVSCARPVMMMSATWPSTPTRARSGTLARSRGSISSRCSQGAYAWATPSGETASPRARIRAAAGPLTAAPPMIGLTATTGAAVERSASTMPGTARIGPTDVTGFEGQTTMTSAARIDSTTPGAGRALDAPS